MPIHLPARVLRDISKLAAKNHIQRIILFGSRARGTHTERSDIDIAVSGGDFPTLWRLCIESPSQPKLASSLHNKRLSYWRLTGYGRNDGDGGRLFF